MWLVRIVAGLLADACRMVAVLLRSCSAIRAENLEQEAKNDEGGGGSQQHFAHSPRDAWCADARGLTQSEPARTAKGLSMFPSNAVNVTVTVDSRGSGPGPEGSDTHAAGNRPGGEVTGHGAKAATSSKSDPVPDVREVSEGFDPLLE